MSNEHCNTAPRYEVEFYVCQQSNNSCFSSGRHCCRVSHTFTRTPLERTKCGGDLQSCPWAIHITLCRQISYLESETFESPLPSIRASWAAVTRRMAFFDGSWSSPAQHAGKAQVPCEVAGLKRGPGNWAGRLLRVVHALLRNVSKRGGLGRVRRWEGRGGGGRPRCGRGGGTANQQLIEDVVGFVEVEDEIQLAHVAKVAVQHLRSGRSTARFRGSGAMNGQVRGGCEVTVSHTTSAGMVPAPSRGSGRPHLPSPTCGSPPQSGGSSRER